MAMRAAFHACVSVALLALLAIPAFAGKKKIDGLIFQPAQASGANCTHNPFLVLQEPGAFFQGLTKTKAHGIEQFRRGEEMVDRFPGELVVTVQSSPFVVPSLCPIIAIDPPNLKFRAAWRDGGTTTVAQGTVVQSESQRPGPWCEDKCDGAWKYELRINSEGVSLRNVLIISVDAADGSHLAEYVGALGSAAEKPSYVLSP